MPWQSLLVAVQELITNKTVATKAKQKNNFFILFRIKLINKIIKEISEGGFCLSRVYIMRCISENENNTRKLHFIISYDIFLFTHRESTRNSHFIVKLLINVILLFNLHQYEKKLSASGTVHYVNFFLQE